MSKLTSAAAFEINNYPFELFIEIGQNEPGGKYGFSISRGEGHNKKTLVTSHVYGESEENAVAGIKHTLETIHDYVTKEMVKGESLLAKIACPSGQVNFSKTLNPELIEKILKELRVNYIVRTHYLLPQQEVKQG